MGELISIFFAPQGLYEPAGMFTIQHFVSLVICLFIVGFTLKASSFLSWEQVMNMTCKIAIVVTVLECIKIAYNFYYGYNRLDAWLPLSFCSLFIYATWLSGHGKGVFKKVGDAYIVIGCLLGGLGFLFVPTTSLMSYPVWHFLSLYSLLFHMLMIYLGMLYIAHRRIPISRKLYAYFSAYFLIAAGISIVLNSMDGSNLMILREPFNIPLKWVHVLHRNWQPGYTLLALIAYLVGPGLFAILTSIWLKNKRLKEKAVLDNLVGNEILDINEY